MDDNLTVELGAPLQELLRSNKKFIGKSRIIEMQEISNIIKLFIAG